jgi:Zn-finger protein
VHRSRPIIIIIIVGERSDKRISGQAVRFLVLYPCHFEPRGFFEGGVRNAVFIKIVGRSVDRFEQSVQSSVLSIFHTNTRRIYILNLFLQRFDVLIIVRRGMEYGPCDIRSSSRTAFCYCSMKPNEQDLNMQLDMGRSSW